MACSLAITPVHADCQSRHNWSVDTQTGFLRIQQLLQKDASVVELAEIERITDHMIALA